jgi:hypothetical protein
MDKTVGGGGRRPSEDGENRGIRVVLEVIQEQDW